MEDNTGQYIRPKLKNLGGIVGLECNWDRVMVLCSITIRIEHDNDEYPCMPICQCTMENAITIILPHLPVIQCQSNGIWPGKKSPGLSQLSPSNTRENCQISKWPERRSQLVELLFSHLTTASMLRTMFWLDGTMADAWKKSICPCVGICLILLWNMRSRSVRS